MSNIQHAMCRSVSKFLEVWLVIEFILFISLVLFQKHFSKIRFFWKCIKEVRFEVGSYKHIPPKFNGTLLKNSSKISFWLFLTSKLFLAFSDFKLFQDEGCSWLPKCLCIFFVDSELGIHWLSGNGESFLSVNGDSQLIMKTDRLHNTSF